MIKPFLISTFNPQEVLKKYHRTQKITSNLTDNIVINTAHLPTKPNQVAKAGRLERKPKSSIKSSTSSKLKTMQNKEVKTSLLA